MSNPGNPYDESGGYGGGGYGGDQPPPQPAPQAPTSWFQNAANNVRNQQMFNQPSIWQGLPPGSQWEHPMGNYQPPQQRPQGGFFDQFRQPPMPQWGPMQDAQPAPPPNIWQGLPPGSQWEHPMGNQPRPMMPPNGMPWFGQQPTIVPHNPGDYGPGFGPDIYGPGNSEYGAPPTLGTPAHPNGLQIGPEFLPPQNPSQIQPPWGDNPNPAMRDNRLWRNSMEADPWYAPYERRDLPPSAPPNPLYDGSQGFDMNGWQQNLLPSYNPDFWYGNNDQYRTPNWDWRGRNDWNTNA